MPDLCLTAQIPRKLELQPHRSELPDSDCPCNFADSFYLGRVPRIGPDADISRFGGVFFNLISIDQGGWSCDQGEYPGSMSIFRVQIIAN